MRASSDLGELPRSLSRSGQKPLPPRPRGLPLVGNAIELFRRPLATVVGARQRLGDTVRFTAGPYDFVTIHRPDDIRHVLVTNHKSYAKSRNYDGLRMVLGNGLVTSDGEFWRRQRKLAQPAFHREKLSAFAQTMVDCTTDWLDDLEGRATNRPVDIHHEMMQLTFRIVGLTLFSMELGSHDEVGPAITVALDHANAQVEHLYMIPTWVPTPANFRFRKALRKLDALVMQIISKRRAGEDKPDLLSMLMAATDETGTERMTDRQLRDEVLTLALAGHETTANALSWTWYLLSKHPDVERRLFQEVQEVLGDRPPRLEDFKALEYTNRVVQESMRLYPPAWMFERQAIADDEIGDYRIPKGTIIGICPWSVHRHPELWPNPEGFDPDRFLPERSENRPRYAYIPFGGGPRVCIGNHFAMMEAVLLVAGIAQRFRLDLDPSHHIGLDPGITLRPRHGMYMYARPRA